MIGTTSELFKNTKGEKEMEKLNSMKQTLWKK